MQYHIGSSTWGHPIVWEREKPGYGFTGSAIRNPDNVPPELCINWDEYQFALWLRQNCRVGDWLYTPGDVHYNKGWYQAIEVNDWCAWYSGALGHNNLNFLSVFAHAPADKSMMTQVPNTPHREDIWWRLHGF